MGDGSPRGRRLESRGHRALRPVTSPRPSATHACPGNLPSRRRWPPTARGRGAGDRSAVASPPRPGRPRGSAVPAPPALPALPPRGLEDVTASHGPRRWYSSRFRPSPPFARDEGGAAGSPVPGGALGSGPRGGGSDPGPGRRPPSGCHTPPSGGPVAGQHARAPAHARRARPDWPSPVTWPRPCPAARAAGNDGRPCACGRRGRRDAPGVGRRLRPWDRAGLPGRMQAVPAAERATPDLGSRRRRFRGGGPWM